MILILATTLTAALGADIPAHPDALVFPDYAFSPPAAADYRVELANGVPVYITEDRELPLINISLVFRGGAYLDPPGKVGLSGIMASQLRAGGTGSMTAEELDEELDFLAARASASSGGTTSSASLNSLSTNLEESLPLFVEMVRDPRFQESRLQITKDSALEGMKQRNDHPRSILSRETDTVLYGDSWLSRQPTANMVASISGGDLRGAHARIFDPANMIIVASGDFDRAQMLETLERAFGDWAPGDRVPEPPVVTSDYDPGIYYVDQEGPQGGVRLGMRSLRRDDPDYIAAAVMNEVLGGGGFASRLVKRVRSDEGLAYGVGSRLSPGIWDEGYWGAAFDSKNSTVALAIAIILEEIDRIRTEFVSDEELNVARNSFIEAFPQAFASKHGMLELFARDEITGRDPSWWHTYRDRVGAVSAEDVHRVAQRLLHAEEMAVIVVGDWGEIAPGDDDGRASMDAVQETLGGVSVELPLRDPLTLQPLS